MHWQNKQERAAFLEAFGGLSEVFGKEFSKFTAKAYFSALAAYEVQAVVQAMESALKQCRFFPKPVELLEFIEGTQEDLKVMAESKAREVLLAVRRHGIYATVQFADPITNAVIRQYFGGWGSVCGTREDAQKWFIKDFSERYVEYKSQGIEDHEPLRGIGTGPIVNYVGGTPRPALEGSGKQQVEAIAQSVGKRPPRNGATAKVHMPDNKPGVGPKMCFQAKIRTGASRCTKMRLRATQAQIQTARQTDRIRPRISAIPEPMKTIG